MSYADFNNSPPYYGKDQDEYFDNGQGIPQIDINDLSDEVVHKHNFLFTQDHVNDYNSKVKTANSVVGTCNDEVGNLFFSKKNIRRIQMKIRNEIYERTNHKYRLDVDQSEQDLLVVMTALYKEKAKFIPKHIIRQVKKLNNSVVDFITPDMITEIKQYYGYIDEINKPLVPNERPVNVSNAGRRSLPSITTTFGLR